MTTLAIVLIAASLVWLALAIRIEIRVVKPTTADEDYLAPPADWISDNEIERVLTLWKAEEAGR